MGNDVETGEHQGGEQHKDGPQLKHDLVEEVMRTMKKEVPNVSFSDASEQHLSAAEIAAARMGSNEANSGKEEEEEELCDHVHHSNRSPWLRALVLGANDGLVSVASLMMGVGAGNADLKVLRLSGVAGLIAGALSMAMGEYVSVSSQRDSEKADIKKEIEEQLKGPAAQARELEELAQIYVSRGIPYDLAKQVAVILTERDVIRAHARDELGIDIDDLSNPWQAAIVSGLCFSAGAAMPLLSASFITDRTIRLVVLALATTVGLILFGYLGAHLGGANVIKGSLRVVIGGWIALGISFGIGAAFNVSGAA